MSTAAGTTDSLLADLQAKQDATQTLMGKISIDLAKLANDQATAIQTLKTPNLPTPAQAAAFAKLSTGAITMQQMAAAIDSAIAADDTAATGTGAGTGVNA